MKAIGQLMIEHRLIEKMVNLLERQLKRMEETKKADNDFLKIAADFFRTYADRTHHGKEEGILFRELAKKQLSQVDQQMMDELTQEHIIARGMVARLIKARENYTQGNLDNLNEIMASIKELVAFYQIHIMKEDKRFFYPSLEYFDEQEQDKMLQEFWEFDRKLIHEKYKKIVEETEKSGLFCASNPFNWEF
jgi:hemerythrin-like domain-containing protein